MTVCPASDLHEPSCTKKLSGLKPRNKVTLVGFATCIEWEFMYSWSINSKACLVYN